MEMQGRIGKSATIWTDKIMALLEQLCLRSVHWLASLVIGLPYLLWQGCINPPGVAPEWVTGSDSRARRLLPITRAESVIWIFGLLVLLAWGFDWSNRDTVHGYYTVKGKRTSLTIKQGQIIELEMPCTIVLTGDIFEVKIRRSAIEQRWVKPPDKAAILIGKRQTRYPIRVTRLGLFRNTVEAVIYAKPD
ncbi:MAG: hypothetical protein CEO22_294 [Candidatus Berkelbacteria bacterium Gr01-1014_85]|uniref:Uncharacterized protein n=1 Tax=Candidatus Berkelbacteria bacterium Gr01-1014_85 TaxID=2017150 RepID=A0A554JC98_9BACT|nr:MAG: hypothetical protein CEO22_294 [Candidatus Berkelbacteria bacterium Gr01-1014_85]